MNTISIEKFDAMKSEELATVKGGGPVSIIVGGVLVWVADKTYDYLANSSTASCRNNPNQWYCVNFKY